MSNIKIETSCSSHRVRLVARGLSCHMPDISHLSAFSLIMMKRSESKQEQGVCL